MNELFATWARILSMKIPPGAGSHGFTLGELLELVVLLGLVVVAEILLRRFFLSRLLQRMRMRPSVQFAVLRIGRYAFLALGIYLALEAVGINLTSLAFMAGALGVGLGFGLQNVVSNFVSGIIILAEQPITIGDRVEVSGATGRVIEISLRSTTIVTNDNICMIVPNSSLITAPVVNWSYDDPTVRTRLPVGVAYGTNVEKLRQLLLEVAATDPDVLQKPAPDVLFVGYGDSAINFELAVWSTAGIDRPLAFKSNLYYAIHKKLEENQIEIPFPQRDLHLRSGTVVLRNGAGATQATLGPALAPPPEL